MLAGATILGPSRLEINGNEDVLYIPKKSRTGPSPSDGRLSYLGHSLEGSYHSADMQSAYSTASADWAASELTKNDYR